MSWTDLWDSVGPFVVTGIPALTVLAGAVKWATWRTHRSARKRGLQVTAFPVILPAQKVRRR